MDTSRIILYSIFITINSTVLFFIYSIISRWMKTTEEKIDKIKEKTDNMEEKINDLEHIVRSTDEYIKYTKHVTDVVYLNYLDGLQRVMVNKEHFEEAEIIKNTIAIKEKMIMAVIKNNRDMQMRIYTQEELKDIFKNSNRKNTEYEE